MTGAPDMLRAAQWYARRWPVFPLQAGGKTPLTAHGWQDATTDPVQIGRWWARWPDANIGLDCGGAGLLVLDFDTGKPDFAGFDLFSSLCNDFPTVTAQTGGGGFHLLYRQPEGEQLNNGRGSLPAGVDVRGHGGYIVLAPSLHPSGSRYRWSIGHGPHVVTAAPLPLPVLDMLRKKQGAHTGEAQPMERGAHTHSGGRDLLAAARCLQRIAADDYDTWIRAGMALKTSLGDVTGYALWRNWSARSAKYDPEECRRKWEQLPGDSAITLGTLVYLAGGGR